MDVVIGCTHGSKKIYNIHTSQPTGMFGALSTTLELQVMKFGWKHMENNENYLFEGFSNGSLKYWNSKDKTLVREFQIDSGNEHFGSKNIRSIEAFGEDKLLVSTLDGTVFIKEFSNINDLTPKSEIKEVVKKVKDGKKVKNVTTQTKITKPDSKYQLLSGEQLKEGNYTVNCMVMNPEQNGFAYGGKNINASLWDLETEQKTWAAKFQHDFLDLRIPVNINAIQFAPNNPSQIFLANDNHLKIYDSKMTAKKPVIDITFSKYHIKTIVASEQDENLFFGADVVGNISAFDKRNPKQLKSFKGNNHTGEGHSGGIRSLAIHPTLPILASVGLDRFLKIWDIKKRKITHNIYLKQKLSSVLFKSEEPPQVKDEEEDYEEEEKEEEDVWDEIEKNTNGDNDDDEESDGSEMDIKIDTDDEFLHDSDDDESNDDSDDDSDEDSEDDKKNKNNKRILKNKPQNNNNKKQLMLKTLNISKKKK